MTLTERQARLIERVNALGDCLDQYHYLITCAGKLPLMAPEHRTGTYLVKGCQSKVWLYLRDENGRLYMEADSDALTLKGVLSLLVELVNGAALDEIAHMGFNFLQQTELSVSFTSERMVGMRSVMDRITAFASGS